MGAGEPRNQASWHAYTMGAREITWGVAPRHAAPGSVLTNRGEAGVRAWGHGQPLTIGCLQAACPP